MESLQVTLIVERSASEIVHLGSKPALPSQKPTGKAGGAKHPILSRGFLGEGQGFSGFE